MQHIPHPSSMDDSVLRTFPIISVELKIRVPDQLIGRLIGKGGSCVKKIMEETGAFISVSDSRNTPENFPMYQQTMDYSTVDRIITIRAASLEAISAAEKRVSLKLRQHYEQDISAGVNYNYHQQNTPMVDNSMIPTYISTGAVAPGMQPRDNAAAFNAAAIAAYSSMPMNMNVAAPVYYQAGPAPGFPIGNQFSIVQPQPTAVHIKSRIFVPDSIVGSLIGTKGQHIKNMMQMTGAIIHIEGGPDAAKKGGRKDWKQHNVDELNEKETDDADEPQKDDDCDGEQEHLEKLSLGKDDATADDEAKTSTEQATIATENGQPANLAIDEKAQPQSSTETVENISNGSPPTDSESKQFHNYNNNGAKKNDNVERSVFISGYDYQVYKAQYWIYQRIAESTRQFVDDLVLQCEAIVPSKVVGRIIGKGGQNVRELQRATHAQVKVPDDVSQNDKNSAETPVRITGNFYSLQMVQARFGAVITEAELKESREYEGRRSRNPAMRPGSGFGMNRSAPPNNFVQPQQQMKQSGSGGAEPQGLGSGGGSSGTTASGI